MSETTALKEGILSVIVPCYNEEDGIEATIDRLTEVLTAANLQYELLFVSDGSRDRTFSRVAARSREDAEHIKAVEFSRNFGKEAAMMAGLSYARGACAVVIDSDLQQPPEVILEMYALWQQGYEIIEGIKEQRQKEGFVHRICAKAFYGVFNKAIGMDIGNASDFKLLDRRVIDVLLRLPEKETFFRGLTFWTGFKMTTVSYQVQPRQAGTSKWSLWNLTKYAIHNIISFSSLPLSLITIQSFFMLFLGFIFAIRALRLYLTGQAAGGITTVVFLMLLIGGLILLALSIIGQYIASIYNEIKGRPRFLVEQTAGADMQPFPKVDAVPGEMRAETAREPAMSVGES